MSGADAPADYLDSFLAPLRPMLAQADATDIFVNREGEVWVQNLRGETARHSAPELTQAWLWQLARQVARVSHQAISRAEPLLAARLNDGSRIQIVAPPATREGFALAIRKQVAPALDLKAYSEAGAFADTRRPKAPIDPALRDAYEAGDYGAFLSRAVALRKTIMVAGGTATGKTTFVNALIKAVPPQERLIAIEDTPELDLAHANAVGLIASRGGTGEARVSADDLLQASLRLRPDRIILGELRGPEAFTFLRAINTGHPGSMTTIHADSADGAMEQLALLVLQTGVRLERAEILHYVAHIIDIHVQLESGPTGRRVHEIRWKC